MGRTARGVFALMRGVAEAVWPSLPFIVGLVALFAALEVGEAK